MASAAHLLLLSAPSAALPTGAAPSTAPSAAPAKQPVAPVVFLGLPKGGTTSFHALMGSLGVPAFHVGGSGYLANGLVLSKIRQVEEAACEESGLPSTPSLLPAYEQATRAVGDAHAFCMVNASGYSAFADDPWPLLWPYLDSVAPTTKFVLWERDPAQWAASAVRFFRDDVEWNWLRFAYGACNMTARYQAHLERVARSHYAAVRDHFLSPNAPPERRTRLLLVDYADAQAGRKVCEFAFGEGAAQCQGIEGMGRAMPGQVLAGADQEEVKMPLGRPDEIPAFRACLQPGGAFSRAVRSPAQRAAHIDAARAVVRRMEKTGWRRRLGEMEREERRKRA